MLLLAFSYANASQWGLLLFSLDFPFASCLRKPWFMEMGLGFWERTVALPEDRCLVCVRRTKELMVRIATFPQLIIKNISGVSRRFDCNQRLLSSVMDSLCCSTSRFLRRCRSSVRWHRIREEGSRYVTNWNANSQRLFHGWSCFLLHHLWRCQTVQLSALLPKPTSPSCRSVSPPVPGQRPHTAPSGGHGQNPPSSSRPAGPEARHHGGRALGPAAFPAGKRPRIVHRAQQLAPERQRKQPWTRQAAPPAERTRGEMLSGNCRRTGNGLHLLCVFCACLLSFCQ